MVLIPTMRAVQAFEAVARCGSVTAAAEELCVSPGAISQQIHNIEEALSASLFERRGRSLTLTSWGRMYYERVRVAFDQLRLAQDTLQLARTKPGIVISALPSLAMRWLRPLIQDWRSTHPNATIRLIGTPESKSATAIIIFLNQIPLPTRAFIQDPIAPGKRSSRAARPTQRTRTRGIVPLTQSDCCTNLPA